MKLDLLYELTCPKPWTDQTERDVYWEALDQIILGDRVGFGTIWAVEHHFLSEFSHSSAPEIFLASVAQRTERIRIGHGVVLLPNPFNYPVRVAERIGALDIMSRGRVEFGTGRSTWYEQAGFGIDPADTREMWEEALRIIPQMWQTDVFKHEGKYFSIPQRNVVPKPLQKPHPPLWVAGTQPESFEIAGGHGIGMLALTIMVPLEETARRIEIYKKAVANANPIGLEVNDRANCLTLVHCAESTEQAIKNGAPQAIAWYLKTVASLLFPPEEGSENAIVSGIDFAQQAASSVEASNPLIENEASKAIQEFHEGKINEIQLFEALDTDDMVVIGDPEHCKQKLRRYEEMGANSVMCQMQIGNIPHPAVMESIRLFGEHIIPHYDR